MKTAEQIMRDVTNALCEPGDRPTAMSFMRGLEAAEVIRSAQLEAIRAALEAAKVAVHAKLGVTSRAIPVIAAIDPLTVLNQQEEVK